MAPRTLNSRSLNNNTNETWGVPQSEVFITNDNQYGIIIEAVSSK